MNEPMTAPANAGLTKGMRVLYSIVFWIVASILCWVLAVVTVLQLLLLLLGGSANAELRRFGRGLARYAGQVVAFLTCVTDTLPFPFTDWPDSTEQ